MKSKKRIISYLIILSTVVTPIAARTVEMTLHKSKTAVSTKQYTLLPKADEQTDVDAAPFYAKALQALPDDLRREEIDLWLQTPPDKLPRKDVRRVLEKLEPTLKLLEQAANCRPCHWPYLYDDEIAENLRQHRRLIYFLALKVRFQIAQHQYDDAIGAARTGFAMARHLGEDTAQVRGLIGISIAAYMCRQLEALVQRPDAPNLYEALRNLPQPLVDLTRQVEWEETEAKEKVHLLMNRLDRHVAALQCIEAIRLYAAGHDGEFPKQLSDVTRVSVPDDPVTGRPFIFSRTGSQAVLEGPAPKGELAKQAIRYELNLVE